jgi:SAM-dependent methyltransferase
MLRQLFEPWAGELVRRAELQAGMSVLDLASGLGPVARLAAAATGRGGRVVASDISAPMLALAAARPVDPGWAPIEYLECSASAIDAEDDSFDVVFCQHGLQFFADREAAAREMRRVATRDGVALVSTWAAERALGLFGPMAETLQELGIQEPFPRAFDPRSYRLGIPGLRELLRAAGFGDVDVETVELDAVWQTAGDAVDTLLGTPFGPLVSVLPVEDQERVRTRLAGQLGESADGRVTVRTASNIARGVR